MKSILFVSTALAGMALLPFAAQAASPDNWTGTTSNAWESGTNWSTGTAPATTSAVTIANTNNNPVQINSNVSLNGNSGGRVPNIGSLTVGAGVGSTETLNINLGDTLTMGATNAVTLAGGSITGPGTLSVTTGPVSGYGTISSQIAGTTFTANATDGTVFAFNPNFVNGTPGSALSLIGQSNLTGDTFTISNHGDFNFQGVTLTTPTLNGVSTNLSAGPTGGNNTYGLLSFTGAASTVVGTVNNTNYQQFNVTGTKVSLNNFKLVNSWATNVPPFFVIGAGGTVDNAVGNSTLNGFMSNILSGGSLTNSGGGSFSAAGLITGFGTISGPLVATGGIKASGGTLIVDGTSGAGITAASAGWATGGGASDVLNLKGTINFAPSGSFPAAPALSPGGGTVQLNNATINTPNGTGFIQTGHGTIKVASGLNTLNGGFTQNGSDSTYANYVVQSGATLSLQNKGGSHSLTGTNEPTGSSAINGQNFTLANGSVLTSGASGSTGNNALTLFGNFINQQTDKINGLSFEGGAGLGPDISMQGGTAAVPGTLATAQTLEVGGIDEGYAAAGFIDNFALHSLTIGSNAYVELMDNFVNATAVNWTAGSEALYLDGLYDGVGIATLNLNGINAYLQGYGQLHNGLYTDDKGDQITIIGAATQVPEPTSLALICTGLLGLLYVRRKHNGPLPVSRMPLGLGSR